MQSFDKHIYRILLGLAIGAIAIGTIVYHIVEKLPWIDAYYFSVVTLATVGYGDISPQTTFGKIFTTFYIFTGVGILTTFLSYSMRRRAHRFSEKHDGSLEPKD